MANWLKMVMLMSVVFLIDAGGVRLAAAHQQTPSPGESRGGLGPEHPAPALLPAESPDTQQIEHQAQNRIPNTGRPRSGVDLSCAHPANRPKFQTNLLLRERERTARGTRIIYPGDQVKPTWQVVSSNDRRWSHPVYLSTVPTEVRSAIGLGNDPRTPLSGNPGGHEFVVPDPLPAIFERRGEWPRLQFSTKCGRHHDYLIVYWPRIEAIRPSRAAAGDRINIRLSLGHTITTSEVSNVSFLASGGTSIGFRVESVSTTGNIRARVPAGTRASRGTIRVFVRPRLSERPRVFQTNTMPFEIVGKNR